MLVNDSKYKDGVIVTFKLVNGDEIIAKVNQETPTTYEIDSPCTVIPSQQGLGLLNSLFTAKVDSKIQLSKNHVMLHSPTVQPWTNHYIQAVTGIEPVSAGEIIL